MGARDQSDRSVEGVSALDFINTKFTHNVVFAVSTFVSRTTTRLLPHEHFHLYLTLESSTSFMFQARGKLLFHQGA